MSVAEKVAGKKVSYVTYDGRTVVNTDALLQDPSVRETITKLGDSLKGRRTMRVKILKRKP